MIPTAFPEQNKTLTKPEGMDDCGSLPVYNDGQQSISCWQMSWRERLSALLRGKVWLQVYAGSTQPPVSLTAAKSVFEQPSTLR